MDDRFLPSAVFGPEFLINTHVGNAQATFMETRRAVASDAAGNFVAVWSSGSQDGSSQGVYAQRFNTFGVPQGAEFRVNSTVQGTQQYPGVAMSPAGNFIITWSSLGQDGAGTWGVYGQRYDAAGNPVGGEFLVNTTTVGNQQHSSVAMDAFGRSVVTWSSHNQDASGSWGIYGQRYDLLGNAVGGEFQVNVTTADDQTHSTVAMDLAGNFVVTWESQNQDGDDAGIFARRFDAGGNALGSEFQVNTTTTGSQEQAHVAMHPFGNFVVTWASDADKSGAFEVFARRYDAAGNPLGAELAVNATPSDDRHPTAAIAANGSMLISWTRDQDPDRNIYARRYTAAGAPVADEFIVNTFAGNDQEFSSVAPTTAGNFVAVWSGAGPGDGAGVFGQLISAAGISVSPTDGLVTTESGGAASFSIVLISQPLAPVTIGMASTNLAEGTVSQPSVTFTPLDWDVPQIITVAGVDDFAADGAVDYAIVLAPSSSLDPIYNNWDPADVTFTNADNDTPGIIVSPVAGLVTSESGGAAGFTVALATAPNADVVVALSTDSNEANLSTAVLTFTSGNWNVAQTVTVTGVDDDIDDGDVVFAVVTAAAVSADANYHGIDADDVAVANLDDDDAGILVTAAAGLTTTEAGGSAVFTIALNSRPSADVTISFSSNAADEGAVSQASVTFTPATWNVARTITVNGVNDFVVDGDILYQVVSAAAVSADPSYDGLDAGSVSIINTDDDSAGILVASSPQLTTTEGGGADAFTVVLTSQPAADVLISFLSSNPSEGTPTAATLTFTAANWNISRQVTITGIDDVVDDGDIGYTITPTVTSLDPLYDSFGLGNLAVTNIDDDVAGLSAAALGDSVISANGDAAPFSVRLHTQPASDVTIALSLSGASGAVLSQFTMTFTPLDWNVPQVVTATVLETPSEAARWDIALIASSADLAYHALSVTVSFLSEVVPPETEITPDPPTEPAPAESDNQAPPPAANPTDGADPDLPSGAAIPVAVDESGADVPPEQPVSAPQDVEGSSPPLVGFVAAEVAPAASEPAVEQAPPQGSEPPQPQVEAPLPPEVAVAPQAPPPLAAQVLRTPVFNPTAALGLLESVHYETESWPTLVKSVFSVGLVASAGYVLLSTKASYWLLTAFAARPLWKQFDPMEVLFAWEEEQERRRARGQDGGQDDESLQTMVDR